jgi:hypothetical protein
VFLAWLLLTLEQFRVAVATLADAIGPRVEGSRADHDALLSG